MSIVQRPVTLEELSKLGADLEQRIVNLGSLEKPDLAIVLMFDSKTRLSSDLEPKPIVLRVKDGMSRVVDLSSIRFMTNLEGKDFTRARIMQQDSLRQYQKSILAQYLKYNFGC